VRLSQQTAVNGAAAPPPPSAIKPPQEIQQMLYAMRAPVPAAPEDLAHPRRWRAPANPFVLDIGANVGWFMVNAAAHGARVAAFEGAAGLPWLAPRRPHSSWEPLACFCPWPLTAAPTSPSPATSAAMPSNIRLLRATLCANPWIRERVALYGTGLGTK
jgi:hypothetical protein